MIRDITLGQFFPADSFVHRLDPRTKLLWTILYMVMVFTAASPGAYLLIVAFTALVALISRVPLGYMLRGLKPLWFLLLFTVAINIFMTPGDVLWRWRFLAVTRQGILIAMNMALRLSLLVVGTSILTLTTSPITLTGGMERLMKPLRKIGVPSHEIAMMMSIALRFIPTLLEETDKIMKAQTARGADFESGKLLRRIKALVPLLVPLFVSAFRRADELAVAMECRCYNGGENRTSLRVLRFAAEDIWALFAAVTMTGALMALKFWRPL